MVTQNGSKSGRKSARAKAAKAAEAGRQTSQAASAKAVSTAPPLLQTGCLYAFSSIAVALALTEETASKVKTEFVKAGGRLGWLSRDVVEGGEFIEWLLNSRQVTLEMLASGRRSVS